MRREGQKRGAGQTCIKDGQLSHCRKLPLATNSTIKNCPLCKHWFLESQRNNRNKQKSTPKTPETSEFLDLKQKIQKEHKIYRQFIEQYGENGGYKRKPHNSPDKKYDPYQGCWKHDHYWEQQDVNLALNYPNMKFSGFSFEDEEDFECFFDDEDDVEFSYLTCDQKVPLSCFVHEEKFQTKNQDEESRIGSSIETVDVTEEESSSLGWENVSSKSADSEMSFEIVETY
eukprot:TRINITY_DN2018_c0_g1_i2.p3 TRINITY_DN2018_c0_g1~~TRINITY_DN2018_c0_g1_i2.p3  ORF type:complete len:229 (+),score=35.09 TRINITY_DN2018_c0_g1_i2:233-919(+)